VRHHIVNSISNINIYDYEFAKGTKGKVSMQYVETTLSLTIAVSDSATGIAGGLIFAIC